MMSCYEQNISILAASAPDIVPRLAADTSDAEIQVVESRKGPVPEVLCDGRKLSVHSRFDPVKEAERFIAEVDATRFDLFIVCGFGFGYHIEALAESIDPGSIVLVIEKSAAMLKGAFRARDLRSILGNPGFILLLDPSEDDIAAALSGKSTRRVTFLSHRGSLQLFPDYYHNMRRVAKSYLSTKEVNIATLAKFEKTWSANIARNIRRIASFPGVEIFFDAFKGYPAIIAAAGPSLTGSMEFIGKNRDRAVIIAVDTSFGLLRRHGIEPHFCLTVDPQVVNARYFEGADPGRTVLVTDPTSHPSALRLFGGRAVMCGMAFQMMQWIEEITGRKGAVAHGGSVSTNACDFARRLGASQIVFVGQDLAFTGGLAHARGSYLDEQITYRTERFFTRCMANRRQLTALPPIFVPGIRSKRVQTNQKMMIFLSWFEKRGDPLLVNATVDGARMPGIRHALMDDIDCNGPGGDIDTLIDTLYDRARVPADRAGAMKAELADICTGSLGAVDELLPRLERAVALSEDLCGIVGSGGRDQGKVDYILKRLAETDRFLETREMMRDMIGLTIQRVIHTITEGYALDDEDESLPEDQRIAKRSLFLYRGLYDGAVFVRRVLKKMNYVLTETRFT
jgi:hypothetical protein